MVQNFIVGHEVVPTDVQDATLCRKERQVIRWRQQDVRINDRSHSDTMYVKYHYYKIKLYHNYGQMSTTEAFKFWCINIYAFLHILGTGLFF